MTSIKKLYTVPSVSPVNPIKNKGLKQLGLALFLVFYPLTQVLANTELAFSWLETQLNADGSYGQDSDISDFSQATSESLRAYQIAAINPPAFNDSLSYLSGQTYSGTEYLSRKIVANHYAGSDVTALLNQLRGYQNQFGGFGEGLGYHGTALDTAFALDAFASVSTTIDNTVNNAVWYLIDAQQADGGWRDGINASNVYTTSIVIQALSAFADRYPEIQQSFASARNFLYSKQIASLWESPFESVSALIALLRSSQDISVLQSSFDALIQSQSVNGSWQDDTYVTAIALRALLLWKNANGSNNNSSQTAGLTGSVVVSGSGEPISGATVSLVNNSGINTKTNSTGVYNLTGLPSGSHTLLVEKPGYFSASVVVTLLNNRIIDAGVVALGVDVRTGVVRGSIFDSTTKAGLSSASIELVGAGGYTINTDAIGGFELTSVIPGSYLVTISKAGYNLLTGNAVVAAGQVLLINQGLTAEGAFLDTTPGTLKGVVIDGISGLPLENAQFLLDNGQSVTTDTQGAFQVENVARGTFAASLNAQNYVSTQYQIFFAAGNSGDLGVLAIYPTQTLQAASTLTLYGTVLDGLTGQGVANALIQVAPADSELTSDGVGGFSVVDSNELEIQLTISSVGYQTLTYTVTASAYGEYSAEFRLPPQVVNDPTVTTTTLTGVVASGGQPISGANVTILGTNYTATSDATGQYQIANIDALTFVMSTSAAGYVEKSGQVELSAHGNYSLDIELDAQQSNTVVPSIFQIVSVEAPLTSLSANTTATIKATIANISSDVAATLVIGEVIDAQGNSVASLSPVVNGTDVIQSEFNFASQEVLTLEIPWDVAQSAPGTYQIIVRAVEVGSITRAIPTGRILAEGNNYASVIETLAIAGQTSFTPPLTQAGATTPVSLSALAINQGNVPLVNTSFAITVSDPDSGSIVYTATTTVDLIDVGHHVSLVFGDWVPTATGALPVQIQVVGADVPGVIAGSLYVGDKATGSFVVNKTVVPEGTQSVRGSISLQGVDTRTGTSTDPLFFAVRDAVETGGEYVAAQGVSWHKRNRCLGCHIQTQSAVGLGTALDKAPIDALAARTMFNSISTSQQSDGGLRISHPMYTRTQTALGIWALTEWPNKEQAYPNMYRAAQHLYDRRTQSGGRVWLRPDHASGWWSTDDSHTALMVKGFADLIRSSESLDLSQVRDYSLTQKATGFGDTPLDMETGPDGKLYTVGYSNREIKQYDPTTNTATTFLSGTAVNPVGLAFSSDGTLFFATVAGTIYQVMPDKSITTFASGLGNLRDIEFGPDGYLYASDYSGRRILRLDTAGAVEVYVSGGLLNGPYGLTFDPNGDLYVANHLAFNILRIDQNRAVSIFADGLAYRPVWMISDPRGGFIYSSSTFNSSSQYTPDGLSHITADGVATRILSQSGMRGIAALNDRVFVTADSTDTLYELNVTNLQSTSFNNYRAATDGAVSYFLGRYQDGSGNNIVQAMRLWGLAEARTITIDAARQSAIDAAVNTIATTLRNRQRSDGGWGLTTTRGSDPMVTALVGIALDYTNPSADDPLVRRTIEYLLATQQADKSWPVYSGILGTKLASTSLVMAYMPKALDRLGGIDVDLHLSTPANVQLSNPTVSFTSSVANANGGTDYLWSLKGITSNDRLINFDLTLQHMLLQEQRAVADVAYMEFDNSFTSERIRVDLDIPLVTATSEMALGVATDKAVYYANEEVAISATVSNTAQVIGNGIVELHVRAAGSNELLATLAPITVDNIAAGEQVTVSTTWNTAGYLAGAYEVFGQLLDNQGRIASEAVSMFSIQHVGNVVTSQVSTDKPIYQAWDSVDINGRVQNVSANVIQPATFVELTVRDPSGAVIYFATASLNNLMPAAISDTPFNTTLVDALAGEYGVEFVVRDNFSRDLITTSYTSFVVERAPLQGLAGTVTASPVQQYQGDPVICHDTANNLSSAALNGVTLSRQLVRLADGYIISQDEFAVDIAGSDSNVNVRTIDTTDLAIGGYFCTLSATLNGEIVQLGAAGFDVREPPIVIDHTISMGDRGRVLVLLDESAAVNNCNASTELGLDLGFVPMLSSDATVQITLLDDQAVELTSETVSLLDTNFPVNNVTVSTGAELSVTMFDGNNLSLNTTDSGGTTLLGGYQIIATVTDSAGNTVYDTGLIQMDCTQAIAVGDVFGGFNVSTLILPPAADDASDPHGPLDAPPLGAQRNYLENLLSNAGWSYTIVTNADDFAKELRTGGYLAYALFSEQVKLDEQVQKEVREAVFRGEGLLVAGSHDNRNHTVFDALGVKLQGKLNDADGVQLASSSLLPQTELGFSYADKVLRIDLVAATADSSYLSLVDGVLAPQADADTALATYTYGDGNGVFVGFDLLAQATSVGGENDFGNLLLAALGHAHPSEVITWSEGVVPVQINMLNQGIATPGLLTIELGGGAAIVDAGTAIETGPTQLQRVFDLAVDAALTTTIWIRLPAAPAIATLDVTLNTGIAPDLTDFAQFGMAVTPLASPMISDAITELQPITADNKSDKAYSRAQNELERAQTSLEAANFTKAMRDLLGATDELSAVIEPDADRIRLMVDEVIREVGRLL